MFTHTMLFIGYSCNDAGSVVQLYNGNPLGYLVWKLEPLLHSGAMLFSHVTNTLTNCSVVSIDVVGGKVLSVLSFYSTLASGDYNKAVRECYRTISEKISQKDVTEPDMVLLYQVLRKAGIDGIYSTPTRASLYGDGDAPRWLSDAKHRIETTAIY